MSVLDYTMEVEVDCLDTDVCDTTFIRATTMIGGRDAVDEFLACGMYPLSSGFGFKDVAIATTAGSKVETTILIFPVEAIPTESTNRFLVKVETDAEKILGRYGPREHDACVLAMLPNSGHLNRVLEQMGVPYALCLLQVPKLSQWRQRSKKLTGQRKQLRRR
jgi:hypothetical protein